MKQRYYIIYVFLLCFLCQAQAQKVERVLNDWAAQYVRTDCKIAPSKLNSYTVNE